MYKTLKFNQNAIQEAEDYYKTVHLGPGQRGITQAIAKIVSNYIPLDVKPLMGFTWRVMKEWQLIHKVDIKDVGQNYAPQQRIEVVKQLLDMAYIELTRVLVNQDQKPLLKQGLNEVLTFYTKNFANR